MPRFYLQISESGPEGKIVELSIETGDATAEELADRIQNVMAFTTFIKRVLILETSEETEESRHE